MPRPAYPPDWAGTVRTMQQGVRAAYTAAQTRVRYAAIRAAAIIIGQETGNTITIDPQRPTSDARAGILFEAPAGAGRGELLLSPAAAGEQGWWTGIFSSMPGDILRRAEVSLLPHRCGMWVQNNDGQALTRCTLTETETRIGPAPGSGSGRGEFWATRASGGGAIMNAYRANGTVAAALAVMADGTLAWSGTWAPSLSSARTMSAHVDPGPDAPTADQVAYLRRVVEAQATEITALRDRVEAMPQFERLDAGEFAHLAEETDTGGEGVNT